jgi:predicted TIM-barrel fold metal-dependent hydrolase
VNVFDANVRLGRLAASRGRYFATADDLVGAMDQLGIARALVYAALARESDCLRGNQLLLELIGNQPRLLPCWVARPHAESPESLVEEMDRHDVRALRLFPRSGHYSVKPWCLGPLATTLARHAKVLLLDFESPSWSEEKIDWEGVYELCSSQPKLPVVVCGVSMASPANYRGFLQDCPNLHLEISQLCCPGEIRKLAETGLEEHLIFGSDLPTRHAGAPLTLVGMEALDETQRRMILGGNFERLLRLTPEPMARTPRRPDWPDIVDTHVHLGGWNHSTSAPGRAEDTVRDMDRCGIRAVVATSLWSCFGEVALGNDDVALACRTFPGRIYGYITLDPKYPDEVRDQLTRFGDNSAFRGIKLHCGTHGVPLTDDAQVQILAFAHERKMPVLVHGNFTVEPWRGLCHRYPDASFIVAHVGGAGPDAKPALDLARLAASTKNLYFDLASTKNYFGFLEELIELAGAEKILYGSDHPLMDFGFELGQVLLSPIDKEKKDMILSQNARRLFNLNQP